MALLLSATLAVPQAARAHTTGISQADFVVEPDGRVRGSFVFAASELSPAQAKDMKSLVVDGVAVSADGQSCAARFEGAQPMELDGVLATATYDCPNLKDGGDARGIEAVLYYLNELSPGHRTAASITAGGKSAQKLLTGDRRLLAIELDRPAPRLSPRKRTVLIVATCVWFASMVALFVWRLRRAKSRKHA